MTNHKPSYKNFAAIFALVVAAILAFCSFAASNDVTANMLLLIAQFLIYSLTLFGFGEIANKIYGLSRPKK